MPSPSKSPATGMLTWLALPNCWTMAAASGLEDVEGRGGLVVDREVGLAVAVEVAGDRDVDVAGVAERLDDACRRPDLRM